MTLQPLPSKRFIRKTELAPNEYRKNFQQIDREILSAVTSAEADQVTPLMSKIYLRLVNAPEKYWEREGVLRIEAELRDEKLVKAWSVLCEMVRVASATASKAFRWMHEQGIIGYFSGKNGVGLRIFLNRAASSIGIRQGQAGKKALASPPASSFETPASMNEPAFNDSYAVREVLDTDINPRAPKTGADTKPVDKTSPKSEQDSPGRARVNVEQKGREPERIEGLSTSAVTVEEIVTRLRSELEPCLKTAAAKAASQATSREMASTREWFETKALPKAVRVAQSESYNLFRKYGTLSDKTKRARAELEVGRPSETFTPSQARPQSEKEIMELAETCVAMLELQSKSVDVTLAEISSEGGGWLLPEDAPKVRELAERLLQQRSERR